VGPLNGSARGLAAAILGQFGSVEGVFGIDDMSPGDLDQPISVVAIMNAFHAEEVDRVMTAALERGWLQDVSDGSQILYLTGAVREPGLIAAREKGIKVVCVGHRACEEWGIRYLASRLRAEFPLLKVEEVYEEEPPPPPKHRAAPEQKKIATDDQDEEGGVKLG